MDDMDRELRVLFDNAGGAPSLTRRNELVEALVARADAGGADVATAPLRPVQLESVSATVSVTSPARKAARAAGIGVGGWIAIGVATAAAATGAWLLEGSLFEGNPAPDVTEPVTTVELGASEQDIAEITVIDPIQADETRSATAAAGEPQSEHVPVQVTVAAEDSASDGVGGSGMGDVAVEPGPASTEAILDSAGSLGDALGEGLGEGLSKGLNGVEGAVKGAVHGLIPNGALADTVKPVIHSVDVDGLAHWIVASLVCADDAPVAVRATDNVGVEAVTVDVSTSLGVNAFIPLSHKSGSTWTGLLSPVTALDLGVLSPVIDVKVTVHDAAGNTSTATSTVPVQVLPCLP